MYLRALDQEVAVLFSRPDELRTHARIIRHQRSFLKPRPEKAYRLIKCGDAALIDRIVKPGVIRLVKPLHVRTEATASRHIQSEMSAKSSRLRQRINQAAKRNLPRKGEIIALGEICFWIEARGTPSIERASFGVERPAARITQRAARRIGSAPPVWITIFPAWASPRATGVSNATTPATCFKLASEGQHQGVNVNDSGGG